MSSSSSSSSPSSPSLSAPLYSPVLFCVLMFKFIQRNSRPCFLFFFPFLFFCAVSASVSVCLSVCLGVVCRVPNNNICTHTHARMNEQQQLTHSLTHTHTTTGLLVRWTQGARTDQIGHLLPAYSWHQFLVHQSLLRHGGSQRRMDGKFFFIFLFLTLFSSLLFYSSLLHADTTVLFCDDGTW